MPPVGSTSLSLIHSRRVFGCLRNKHARGIKSGDLIGWPRIGPRLLEYEFFLREFGTKYGSPWYRGLCLLSVARLLFFTHFLRLSYFNIIFYFLNLFNLFFKHFQAE